MKIQELADKMGLTIHTIRFYEKEGLLDERHVRRESNNYRTYSEEAVARLKLVKKFQSIGCSLAELKEVLQDHDSNAQTNQQIIDWIRGKQEEIESKKKEYDRMLDTLDKMLSYRILLADDPQKAEELLKSWHADTSD
ncbi:MerR family transcriptional regulator [Paenibacillus sacheonensis]|uniref:MerR family transcriptional regulator n=1 Tax=Paenibacillus sacheonensis TaxID=742054 RepID=A0A7X4YPB4_9BACL|nr:MerR family transcriptional regulator [Paenibacillus sacheonensis]MBM7565239.1 DNA-binding transcriptional MerR regulator [Paenibacillus sacheonensis]NBC69985.1 MerR family transcriptional regulator [Paenibacillus sacheonensis]